MTLKHDLQLKGRNSAVFLFAVNEAGKHFTASLTHTHTHIYMDMDEHFT